MKRTEKVILLSLALLGSTGLMGCYVERRTAYRDEPYGTSYEYYYYPSAEVYFYPRTRLYYWHDHGNWRWGHSVPHGITVQTPHVTLNVPAPDPWRRHEEYRSRYPHDWH